jgi:hypothetical protein
LENILELYGINEMNDFFKIFAVSIIVVLVVFGFPIMTITAINELFKTTIEVNFWTWLSAFWLTAIIGGGSISNRKK